MNEEKICCPKFDPILWDGKVFEWENKKFIKDKVFTLFYMPINFGSVMTRLCNVMERTDTKMPDGLMLADHTSKWNMDLYLAVDKEIHSEKNVTLSGRFLSKVYEGDFKNIGKWEKDFEAFAKEKQTLIKKVYMWYTTCPKCAKKYGKNYVAIVGQIA